MEWFWVDSGKRCRTGANFTNGSSDGEITITVKASDQGDSICVRVENNQGQEHVQEHSVQYVDPGTVTPPGPVEPPVTPPVTPIAPVEGQVRVPKTWPGQAAWDVLSSNQKIASNPWGCVESTQIRGDNGQCLSGGTSLTDADYVYVNSLADSGDSSTTPAPGPVDPGPVDPGPVDPAPVDPAPVDPAPVDPAPVDPGDGDDGDDGDDEDEVDSSLSLNFDAEAKTVEVSVGDGVSNVRYVIQDESGQCNEDGVSDDDAADVEGTSVAVTDEDIENGSTVCVFATVTDEDGDETVKYMPQSLSEDADDGDEGSGDEETEEGGSGSLWLIIAVVAVLIVGIVVALVFSGKRNQ